MSDMAESPWAAEAEERWGDTDAWKQSQKRTAKYGKSDWDAIKAEAEEIEAAFASAMADGAAPDSERATDIAEEARLHIDRRFYACSHAMHVGLAEMYTADPRFRSHYDDRAEGLADYVAAAIRANAERSAD